MRMVFDSIVMILFGIRWVDEICSSWEDIQWQIEWYWEWGMRSRREQSNGFNTPDIEAPWSVGLLNKMLTVKPSTDMIAVTLWATVGDNVELTEICMNVGW